VTIDSLIKAYSDAQYNLVKTSTWKRNEWQEKMLSKIIGKDVLVDKLTASFVLGKLTGTGDSPTRVNQRLKTFRAMMRWGYKHDMVASVEWMKKLENLPEKTEKQKDELKYLEKAELDALLGAMPDKDWNLLTRFLVLTGMRIGEAIALEKADVDLDARTINIDKTYDMVNEEMSEGAKTPTSTRKVHIQPELVPVINEISEHMRKKKMLSTHFFCGNDGKYIKYDDFRIYLAKATKKTVGRRLTPHALRHTYVSLAAAAGIPLETISRHVGHAGKNVTKIYLHVTEKMKERDNQTLDAVNIL
jgi:integrase